MLELYHRFTSERILCDASLSADCESRWDGVDGELKCSNFRSTRYHGPSSVVSLKFVEEVQTMQRLKSNSNPPVSPFFKGGFFSVDS